MNRMQNIVILTGAGISAESGLATFRGPDGLWEGHRVEDVCTPEALARDPVMVHRFYDARRAALSAVKPNPAHAALARLDMAWSGDLLIVTQNVDDLHERAGARRMMHMHGELLSGLCAACDTRQIWEGPMLADPYFSGLGERQMAKDRENEAEFTAPICEACGMAAIRPDIVFFGEMPYQMDRIEQALANADLFVSIGTSGAVYPAAGFVRTARHYGADTLELNLEPSEGSIFFHETQLGPASELVPAWVDRVLQ